MKLKFLRSDTSRHLRLGKKRRKLQKWRMPRGRHNKIRRKRFGYPLLPGIGFRKPVQHRDKINGLQLMLVHNPAELAKLGKNQIAVLARTGARKKLAMLKYAQEKGIKIANMGRPENAA